MAASKIMHFSPGRVLLASFGFVIMVGTMLLSLPQAQEVSISFIDTFFTAASTTCVTGMNVIPISSFTFFGKCVILVLMQIGGLGLMTLSFFLISLVLKMGMTTKMMAGQLLEFELWGKVKTFLILIIGLTFGIELVGATLLYFPLRAMFSTYDAAFYALFHSVSAFCNAGISLFEDGMTPFISTPFVLLVLSALVVAGGIGFIVWYDLYTYAMRSINALRGKPSLYALTLHSKLVLLMTGTLLTVGTFFIWFIERSYTLKALGPIDRLINAFFCSVCARSAGFAQLDFATASHATLFILLILMFIGASPSSTGAGIKTTTFALFCASVSAMIRNREEVEIFGRTITSEQLFRVMALVTIASSWIGVTTFVMLIIEKDFTFIQLLFETVSAFATCGFSTGITAQLSLAGKLLLIINMIVGRIGSLTLILALRKNRKRSLYRYPEEKVVIS